MLKSGTFIDGFTRCFSGEHLSGRNSALDHVQSSAVGAAPASLKARKRPLIFLRSSASGEERRGRET